MSRSRRDAIDPRMVTMMGSLVRDAGQLQERVLDSIERKARTALEEAQRYARKVEVYCDALDEFLNYKFKSSTDRAIVVRGQAFHLLCEVNELLLEALADDIAKGELLLKPLVARIRAALVTLRERAKEYDARIEAVPNAEDITDSLLTAGRGMRRGVLRVRLSAEADPEPVPVGQDFASPVLRNTYSDDDLDFVQ
jgi:hypothetical protein